MNPTIDFYILNTSELKNILLFTCKLIEKVYQKNHRIYVHTENQLISQELDTLLWTYKDESFLPHHVYEEIENAAPIQIGWHHIPKNQHDVLINLHPKIPEFYAQFNRVLEIVSGDSTSQTAARENYKWYRERGHALQTHHTN